MSTLANRSAFVRGLSVNKRHWTLGRTDSDKTRVPGDVVARGLSVNKRHWTQGRIDSDRICVPGDVVGEKNDIDG